MWLTLMPCGCRSGGGLKRAPIGPKRAKKKVCSDYLFENSCKCLFIQHLDLTKEHSLLTRAPVSRSVTKLHLVNVHSCAVSNFSFHPLTVLGQIQGMTAELSMRLWSDVCSDLHIMQPLLKIQPTQNIVVGLIYTL